MADTPMRLDPPKERRGSIPSLFSSGSRDSGDPTQRRRGNVLSSADMLGVRRSSTSPSLLGSNSSKGSTPASSKASPPNRGKDGSSFSAAAAAAAAAVPERSDSFKVEIPAFGEKRRDSFSKPGRGEGGGTEGGGKGGPSTQTPPPFERRPSKEALSFGASEESFTGFSDKELNTIVDLRVFMDPAPHTISELAPMASVYHMFNQVSEEPRLASW
jgi:hypothetical protein